MPVLSVRAMTKSDIDLIVNYWSQCTDEDFLRMGVDKDKFIISSAFRDNLENIAQGDINEAKVYFLMWMIEGQTVGYSSLRNIKKNEIGDIHLHLFDSSLRGKGYGSILFCMSVLEFYELFNLKLMLCEPRASNFMPNQMLKKIGFEKWKTYISTPAEVALTCEVQSYIINREKAELFLSSNENDIYESE